MNRPADTGTRPSSRRAAADLIEACYERIEHREADVRAWQWLCPDWAMEQLPYHSRDGGERPLYGVPVGVKDVIDTVGYPTSYGSSIYQAHVPIRDASVVAILRRLGGIVLGKTVTTEFALFEAGKTRNPQNLSHTPGGSSSGSAAAVADGMVPWAIGTQTAGSIIRPASFCGCVGYKPTFGWLERSGVRSLADSLDTLGVFATTVAEAAYLVAALSDRPYLRVTDSDQKPAVALCRTPQWAIRGPDLDGVWDEAKRRLSEAGLAIHEIALPPEFDALADVQATILKWEAARSCAHEMHAHRDRVSDANRSIVEAGMRIQPSAYDRARAAAVAMRRRCDGLFGDADVLIVPSAPGEAPKGLDFTGDPAFNKIWTLLHVPCINVPGLIGPRNLPVGLQVVGRIGDDRTMLRAAAFVERALSAG